MIGVSFRLLWNIINVSFTFLFLRLRCVVRVPPPANSMRRSRSSSFNFNEMPCTCLRLCRLDRFDRVVITTKALQDLNYLEYAHAREIGRLASSVFAAWRYAPTQACLPRKRRVLRHVRPPWEAWLQHSVLTNQLHNLSRLSASPQPCKSQRLTKPSHGAEFTNLS